MNQVYDYEAEVSRLMGKARHVAEGVHTSRLKDFWSRNLPFLCFDIFLKKNLILGKNKKKYTKNPLLTGSGSASRFSKLIAEPEPEAEKMQNRAELEPHHCFVYSESDTKHCLILILNM